MPPHPTHLPLVLSVGGPHAHEAAGALAAGEAAAGRLRSDGGALGCVEGRARQAGGELATLPGARVHTCLRPARTPLCACLWRRSARQQRAAARAHASAAAHPPPPPACLLDALALQRRLHLLARLAGQRRDGLPCVVPGVKVGLKEGGSRGSMCKCQWADTRLLGKYLPCVVPGIKAKGSAAHGSGRRGACQT